MEVSCESLRPLKLGESSDDAINGVLQFAHGGFGETAFFEVTA